ncbi:MAG: DUF2442 domain-containing protein [Spirosomataceae bacterium]
MEITATRIWFDDSRIFAELNDGRVVGMPLVWFPRLKQATDAQRTNYELWEGGAWIHWEELDEDLSAEGFLSFKREAFYKTV